MNRLLLFLLACLSFFGMVQADMIDSVTSLWSSNTPPPPHIKVLVLHDQEGVRVEVRGKYALEDPHAQKHISTRLVGKTQTFQAIPSGLKWGEEFPGLHQIELVPSVPETQILVNGVEYKGRVQIYDVDGAISVVNDLPVEEYLSYLLPEKYQQPLPDEVLAALAITARTDTSYQAQNPKNKFWGVDARQSGYVGYRDIDPNNGVIKALRNTRYMVMSHTGTYERVVTPFAASWESPSLKATASQISLAEAIEMAKQGAHAANILEKAFPRTTIQLIYTR
jgi:Stage II sporulation protein